MRFTDHCTRLWGAAHIVDADPEVEVVRDAFYVPFAHGACWGLFHSDGRVVEASVDFRNANRETHGQILDTDLTAAHIEAEAPEAAYIYGGMVNAHFGHFLINTLPRFWAIAAHRPPGARILCHGGGNPEGWFALPFIARAFGLLGLTPQDFVSFDAPVRLRSVVVPATSLREQQAGHCAYGRLGRAMGEQAYDASGVDTDDRPIYYSKSRLTSAVGVIVNETEIEEVLRAEGVEIVHPETLSLDEQIRLMASRRFILGSAGSFLHASIFCPPRRITCLNVTAEINSNYTIIDALAGNRASYNYPRDIRVLDKVEGFITARHLPNAREVARELLDIMHAEAEPADDPVTSASARRSGWRATALHSALRALTGLARRPINWKRKHRPRIR